MSPFTSCPSPTTIIPCSGHGILQSNGLCICSDEWTDANDLFDGRIVKMNGTWYSQDCRSSVIGIRVIYSFTLLAGIIRLIQLIQAFYQIHQRRKAKSCEKIVKDMTYRVLLIELCIVTPCYLIFTLLKLITLDVVGTDIAITIFPALTTLAYLVASADLELKEFQIFAGGGMPVTKREKLITLHRRFIFGSFIIFGLGAILPFIALGLDKSIGPICNGSYIILLIRLASILGLQLFHLLGKIEVRNGLLIAAETSANNSSNTDNNKQHQSTRVVSVNVKKNDKAQEVIATLNAEVKRAMINNIVLFILILVFMLPWLWPQYTFFSAFAISMTGLRHAGRHFIQVNKGSGVAEGGGGDNRRSNNNSSTHNNNNKEKGSGAVVVVAVGG
jgi:hypothetical protein